MDFLKYFSEFLNENDGFGNSYFHEKKIDKDLCYFFKTGDQTDEERGFIIKMGKFSKTSIISDGEASYSVMSIEEIAPLDMDSYLVDETPYKPKGDEKISISINELNRISDILTKVLDDYLQKSPKVVKIYDEMLENIEMDPDEYENFMSNVINVWSKGRWSIQNGASDKTFIYNKLSHD